MKYYFLLLLLPSLSAIAQKKPVQSQVNKARQMQAKMRQEMAKELNEMEKENPELAKKAGQMLLQKIYQKNTSSISAPKPQPFLSPVETIPYKGTLGAPSPAQATDKLLWYKGKKINDSILITPSSTLVLYSKTRNKVVVRPDIKQDPFKKIEYQLSKSAQQKNDFISGVAARKNMAFFYPAILNTLKEFDQIQNDYAKVLKNSIDLPALQSTSANSYRFHKKSSLASVFLLQWKEIPEQVRKAQEELLRAIEHPESLDFPAPPAQSYDVCFVCDSNATKKFDNQAEKWSEAFKKYEVDLIRKSISVIRELTWLGEDGSEEGTQIVEDMQKVMQFALARIDNKIATLVQQFGSDMSRMPTVIREYIGAERQKQLLGINEEGATNMATITSQMFAVFDKFLEDQMNKKNYSVIFNFPFIIGMEKQKQLLGAGEDESLNYIDQMEAFNRFALSMEVEFEVVGKNDEGPTLIATGTITTPKEVYVSLGFYNCKYQLFLTGTQYGQLEEQEKNYRIPLQVKSGVKKVKMDNKWTSFTYSGPKEMLAVFPAFKIDFCDNNKQDSVYLQILRYETDDLSPYAKAVERSYSIDLLGYLTNLFFTPSRLEKTEGEVKDLATNFMKMASYSQVGKPTGNASLDKLQNGYNLATESLQYQENLTKMAMFPKALILFDARNNASVLIDAEANLAHKVAEEIEVSKGLIKIKVVHDPASYYRPPSRKPLKKQ